MRLSLNTLVEILRAESFDIGYIESLPVLNHGDFMVLSQPQPQPQPQPQQLLFYAANTSLLRY